MPNENIIITAATVNLNHQPPKSFIMTEQKALKLLPCGATKKEVFKMYPKMPDSKIRKTIHYCQEACNPHLSEKEIKHSQWLSRNVIKRIVEIEGVPAGYENRFK